MQSPGDNQWRLENGYCRTTVHPCSTKLLIAHQYEETELLTVAGEG